MPQDVAITTAAILFIFGLFALALAYADYQTRLRA